MSLLDRWRERLTPADQREIWEWIAQEGQLPPVYAISGKLDIETCPMIMEPLRALRSPIVRNVVVMSGVQCLKTLIGECWLLWLICNDPGPSQWLHSDDQEAQEHCVERFIPLMEQFPAVHKFYTPNRHDKTKAFIRFAHMFLRIEGAHNRGNVQRKSIKNQMRSEIWQADKWIPGRLKEADARLTQFVHNSKTYTESQPGWHADYAEDDMHSAYLSGDQNILNFACESCKRLQPFLWDHKRHDGTRAALRWDDTPRTRHDSGEWRFGELIQTVRYECIHCGHRHVDDPITRRRISRTLQHVPDNPNSDPATRSFSWNQLAMSNLSWFETKLGGVKNFLEAHQQAKKGFDKPLRDFWMKVVGEPYNPAKHSAIGEMETIEIQVAAKEGEAPIIEHEGIKFIHRFMGVDVQADHFWLLVEAWSAAGDSLSLHAERVFTWADVHERQTRWSVADQDVLIDVSHRGHEVKIECTRHGHWAMSGSRKFWVCWKPVAGSDQDSFLWIPKAGKNKGNRIQLPYSWPPQMADPCMGLQADDPRRQEFKGKACFIHHWSNPTIKDVAIARRDGKVAGVKNLVARGEWNAVFNLQMHSQKKVHAPMKYGGGKWRWEKFRDDHLLDCKCEIIMRAFQLGLLGPQSEQPEKS